MIAVVVVAAAVAYDVYYNCPSIHTNSSFAVGIVGIAGVVVVTVAAESVESVVAAEIVVEVVVDTDGFHGCDGCCYYCDYDCDDSAAVEVPYNAGETDGGGDDYSGGAATVPTAEDAYKTLAASSGRTSVLGTGTAATTSLFHTPDLPRIPPVVVVAAAAVVVVVVDHPVGPVAAAGAVAAGPGGGGSIEA